MSNQPKYADSFNSFAVAIFNINASLLTSGDALTKPVGQSSARWRVLGRIAQEPQTVSQIARIIGIARQSVQRVADDLVSEKLVKYSANPNDQRAQLLELTAQGQDTLKAIEAEQQRWVERLLAVLDEQELAKLTEQLKVISGHIVSDYQQTFGRDHN